MRRWIILIWQVFEFAFEFSHAFYRMMPMTQSADDSLKLIFLFTCFFDFHTLHVINISQAEVMRREELLLEGTQQISNTCYLILCNQHFSKKWLFHRRILLLQGQNKMCIIYYKISNWNYLFKLIELKCLFPKKCPI